MNKTKSLPLTDPDQLPPADIIDPPERLGPVGSIIDPSYTVNEAVINRLEANISFTPTKDLQKLLTILNVQQEQRKDKILAPIIESLQEGQQVQRQGKHYSLLQGLLRVKNSLEEDDTSGRIALPSALIGPAAAYYHI
jgi:hypothetical protein